MPEKQPTHRSLTTTLYMSPYWNPVGGSALASEFTQCAQREVAKLQKKPRYLSYISRTWDRTAKMLVVSLENRLNALPTSFE